MKKIAKKEKFINNCWNYFGGKGVLLPQILPLVPKSINNYIEIFSGGFTVGLNVEAKRYFYNDKSLPMVNMVRTFKENDTQQILRWIDQYILEYGLIKGNLPKEEKLILQDRKNCPKEVRELLQAKMGVPGYMLLRDKYNSIKVNTVEKDIILYTLICFAFNNQLGFNGSGDYNIPKGNGRSNFNSSLRNKLEIFSNFTKRVDLQISSEDFNYFKEFPFEENDFVYNDPPYILSDSAYDRSIETRWDVQKEKELLEFLDYLNSKKVNFMLSNVVEHKGKTNDLLLEWSNKYSMYELDKNYGNCNYQVKKDKGITREVVVINYMSTSSKEPKIISIPNTTINQDCIGSNFDYFLKEEGIFEQVEAKAKETVAEFIKKRNNYEDSFKKEMVERNPKRFLRPKG